MRTFVAVAETGGFASAARATHQSAPAVTRAVAALEDAIGARLFVRTTRTVKLTDEGRRYFEDCRRILAEIAEAEAQAAGSHGQPVGALTVTAPAVFGRLHVLPVVLDFLDRHPGMTIHTAFVDRITNLVDEGIDVAIRIAHLPDSSLHARRVGTIRRVVCGAPGYFEQHGTPGTPADLGRHRIIGRSGLFGSNQWRFGRDEAIAVDVRPRLYCNTNDAAIDAVLAGWGLSRFQSYQTAPHVLAGRLRIVLAEFEEAPVPVHVVHAEGHGASARVRAFVDFAVERLRTSPMLR